MSQKLNQSILIVEDSDEDFAALSRAIAKSKFLNPIYRCEDGEEALDFLFHEADYRDPNVAPRPAIIILDLNGDLPMLREPQRASSINLPGTDGREVLSAIKQDDKLQSIPAIVFSTSSNPKDIASCYRHGIGGYVVKPMNFDQLQKLIETLLAYWFKAVELPDTASNN